MFTSLYQSIHGKTQEIAYLASNATKPEGKCSNPRLRKSICFSRIRRGYTHTHTHTHTH
jgi:hypothetical protein